MRLNYLFHPDAKISPIRIVVALGGVALYILVFLLLQPTLGNVVASFAVFPVTVAAWLLGLRGGLLVTLLVILLNGFLLNTIGMLGWGEFIRRAGPGAIAMVVVSIAIGWISELLAQVKKQSRALAREREALQEEITERERAEAMLRKLSSAVEQTADHVFITDREGHIEYVNPAFEKLTGYSMAEVIGQTPRLLKSGKHDQKFYEQFWGIISSGQVFQTTLINKKKNGELYYEAKTVTPIKNKAGHLTHFVSTGRDVTERRRAEQALQESEERFRCLVEQAGDAIFIIDSESRFADVNQQACDSLGYTREELLTSSVPDIGANLKPGMSVNMAEVLVPGKHFMMESFHRRKDGTTFPVEISFSMFEAGGEQFGLALARDITERKQAEEALALAHDQALEASCLKSQLLANVSHDLRTPLNAILGHTQMLQNGIHGPLLDKQHHINQRIISNVANLTEMVNRLMDQAQLEAGTLKLTVAPFATQDLIKRIQSTMKVLAKAKGLQLSCDIAANIPPMLSGDADQLYQILINLVGNAIKFTEQGSVQIRIYQFDEAHWALQVSDTGPGIPAEAQAYIFDPFRQVDGTVTRKHKGSGLGLSIVRQLVTMMAGEITLKSHVDQGSTFTILLPLARTQEIAL